MDKTQEVVDKGFEGLHCCNPDSYGDKLWLLEGTPLLWKFEEKISQAAASSEPSASTSLTRGSVRCAR